MYGYQYRKKMIFISVVCLIVALLLFGFVKKEWDTTISFSRDSGFYEEEFYLELSASSQYEIRYTLDGSDPVADSAQYTDPLLMKDATVNENIYSAREDTSVSFYGDVMAQYDWPEGILGYAAPEENVDKCNIVRVALFDKEGEKVAEDSRVYFVGFNEKTGYDGMYIVSIVTDPHHLFDYEDGIYVTGKRWDEFAGHDNFVWIRWDANYFGRGIEWERPAVVTVFNEEREEVLFSEAGIRIQGGASRTNAQKSFNVFAREEYSGTNVFESDLFQNGIGVQKFTLTAGGNDYYYKIRDYLAQSISAEAELEFATAKMIPCVLFLDGEFWGFYYIAESYGDDYIATHYRVDKENVVMVKNFAIEEGEEQDLQLYEEMVNYITGNDMREADKYEKACELIDIESFIDYYATEIYLANIDWPYSNTALWRARETSSKNKYCDGRWRWMLFDINLTAENADIDTVTRTAENDLLFQSLMQNEKVQDMFAAKVSELGENVFSEENVNMVLDSWLTDMGEIVTKSNDRFFSYTVDLEARAELMKVFFTDRPKYMKEHVELFFENQIKEELGEVIE